ncbi:hypothetical protein ACQP06_07855 [Nocardia sp. CA-136227]|uniref:hypothetical protein n=1 Tax=Nocardia sp. CA-136227 TaxID=3239979 RepID=UPI003D9520BF
MTTTTILTVIASAILIIQSSARIPAALAELFRACQQVIIAARELKGTAQQRNPARRDECIHDTAAPRRRGSRRQRSR